MSGFKHFHPLVGALFGGQNEIFDPPIIPVEVTRVLPIMVLDGEVAVSEATRHSIIMVDAQEIGGHSLPRHALVMVNVNHIGAIKTIRHGILRAPKGRVGSGEFCHHMILTSAIPMTDSYLSEGTGIFDVQVDIPEIRTTAVESIEYKIGNNIADVWVSTGLTTFPASFEILDGMAKPLFFRIILNSQPSESSMAVELDGIKVKAGYYIAGGTSHETPLVTADVNKCHLVAVTNYDSSPTADTPVVTYGAEGRGAGLGTVLTEVYNFLGATRLRTCIYMVPTGVGTDFTIKAELINSSTKLAIGVYEMATGLNAIGAVNGGYSSISGDINVAITPTATESILVQLAFCLNGSSDFTVNTPVDMGVVEATYTTSTGSGRFVYTKKSDDIFEKTLIYSGEGINSHRDMIAIELKSDAI